MILRLSQLRTRYWTISSLLILLGIAAMVMSWTQFQSPLRLGLDFVGGTRLQLERDCTQAPNCDRPLDISAVREVLDAQGLGGSSIQILGTAQQAVSIRTPPLDVDARTQLSADLTQRLGTFDANKTQIDTVGPTLGRQLLVTGLLALMVAFAGIILYLTVRFQLDYALFAIVALFHDVLIATGVFAVLGLVQGIEVDSLFIVALLTIIGFSVNDTVVIYDRVRENQRINPEGAIAEIVDVAVNQTLGRSINTTLTTLLPLLAIVVFGGATLKYFALALMIGFIAGAYSSIFIASTLLVWWRERTLQPAGNTNPKPMQPLDAPASASPEDS